MLGEKAKRDDYSPRFCCLFIHHSIGDNFEDSVVTTAATG
jgi:hypothetical protein